MTIDKTDRPGEIRAAIDPAGQPGDAKLVFIGRAQTPWKTRKDCPKNLREARERGGFARIEVNRRHGDQANFFPTSVTLWPPKPNELLRTALTLT